MTVHGKAIKAYNIHFTPDFIQKSLSGNTCPSIPPHPLENTPSISESSLSHTVTFTFFPFLQCVFSLITLMSHPDALDIWILPHSGATEYILFFIVTGIAVHNPTTSNCSGEKNRANLNHVRILILFRSQTQSPSTDLSVFRRSNTQPSHTKAIRPHGKFYNMRDAPHKTKGEGEVPPPPAAVGLSHRSDTVSQS